MPGFVFVRRHDAAISIALILQLQTRGIDMPAHHAIRIAVGIALASSLLACASMPGTRAQAAAEVDQAWAVADGPLLAEAINDSWRSASSRVRDEYRHPQATLEFFRVGSRARVIEISPGAGWYTEILAPYLRDSGAYIAATASAPADTGAGKRNAGLKAKFAADAEHYDRAQYLEYDGKTPSLGAPGSVDVVLTFRNVHNWVAADNADAYFKAFYDVLKPGGVLGVVDHRAKPGTSLADMKKSGYLSEDLVIELATRAGFRLDARSEINANAKDTANHPNGVWTLPPTNRHDKKDAAKYAAVGESDRMTLRFVKPRLR